MTSTRCRFVVLLALTLPARALAVEIVSPGEDSNGFKETYEDGEDIYVETADPSQSCTVSLEVPVGPPTLIDSFTTSSSPPYHGDHLVDVTADGDGTYEISCGGATVHVRIGAHRRLWLDHSAMVSVGSGVEVHDVTEAYALESAGSTSWPSSHDRYSVSPPGPPRVQSATDSVWADTTGFKYLMDVAVDLYAVGDTYDHTNLPHPARHSGVALACDAATPDFCTPSTLDTPSALMATPRSFRTHLERLALLTTIHDEFERAATVDSARYDDVHDPMASSTVGDQYSTGLTYWADYLAAATWPTDDLEHSDLLIALAEAYDLGYPDLTTTQRRAYRKKLYDEALWQYEKYGLCDPPYDSTGTKPNGINVPGLCAAVLGHTGYPLFARRTLRNGHNVTRFGALGIAANVLYWEMQTTTNGYDTKQADWATAADNVGQDILYELGSDGADSAGVSYSADDIDYLVRYIESNRLDPTYGSTVDSDWYSGWFDNYYQYFLHTTEPDPYDPATTSSDTVAPSGWRSLFGDAETYDANGPSHLLALMADVFDDLGGYTSTVPMMQRLAWQGNNLLPFGGPGGPSGVVHRDAIDLLWWRRDVNPLYDGTTFDATVTHHCFADVGLVSFRSAWKPDATHLLYQGGRMFGDHDHTSLGSFTLYRHGYLVSSEGNDQVSKRTVNGATLLVNGYGQHGDGLAEAPAVPEHGTSTPPDDYNNSKLTVYLDNKGVGPDSKHFDVAIAGTDLLPCTASTRVCPTTGVSRASRTSPASRSCNAT